MAYRVAVASSDGVQIDRSFGAADTFLIYEAEGENDYHLLETRVVKEDEGCERQGCGFGIGCNGAGSGGHAARLSLIEDCRCILCKKIGFQVRRQLEKKAISVFDIECGIDDALGRITLYFDRIDHHQNLRGMNS